MECYHLDLLLSFANIIHRAGMDEISFAQNCEMRTYLLHFIQHVAGQDDRLSVRGNALDDLPNFGNTHRIKSVGRFIENEYDRIIEKCRGDGQSLLHTERIRFIFIALAVR